jgi:hypothetical protein
VADPAAFAAVAVTLYAAHQVADHVVGQTDKQACRKALPGWEGWRHNLGHVGLYHLAMAGMLAFTVAVLDLPVSLLGFAAGLAFSAATHALLDRRRPVVWILRRTGSALYAETPEGKYQADQALHVFYLWVSALLVVTVG